MNPLAPVAPKCVPSLSELMSANIDAGMPECARADHVWFGSASKATCAVCLLTSEELFARDEADDSSGRSGNGAGRIGGDDGR